MGGDVKVKSTLGEGSVFTLMVPIKCKKVGEAREALRKTQEQF